MRRFVFLIIFITKLRECTHNIGSPEKVVGLKNIET